MFDYLDPRAINLVLGVAIGMTLSLVWHAAMTFIR